MKKLELEIFFDGKSIQIVNEPYVIEQMNSRFKPGYLDAMFKDAFQWKSNQHMGRFFGAVASLIHDFLKDSGYDFPDKLASLYYIMENLPSDNGFGLSDKWVEVAHGPSGNMISRKAVHISAMSKSDLLELEKDLTKFLNEMGIEVPDSEEFKSSKCTTTKNS